MVRAVGLVSVGDSISSMGLMKLWEPASISMVRAVGLASVCDSISSRAADVSMRVSQHLNGEIHGFSAGSASISMARAIGSVSVCDSISSIAAGVGVSVSQHLNGESVWITIGI